MNKKNQEFYGPNNSLNEKYFLDLNLVGKLHKLRCENTHVISKENKDKNEDDQYCFDI